MSNAREQLNLVYLSGCFGAAVLLALLAQSWVAFFIALIAGVIACAAAGSIRPAGPNRRGSR